jgi:hypothetical protein
MSSKPPAEDPRLFPFSLLFSTCFLLRRKYIPKMRNSPLPLASNEPSSADRFQGQCRFRIAKPTEVRAETSVGTSDGTRQPRYIYVS